MKAAVVGTFDGVHLGHSYLIGELRRIASARGVDPLVVTFTAHPLALLAPEQVPPQLTDSAERRRLLEAEGVEVAIIDFDPQLRSLTAAEFLQMMHRRYDVRIFLLGYNNRIGSDRLGAAELAGKTVSGVEIIGAEARPQVEVSSSLIRRALGAGNVEAATRMLGRPYAIEGKVVEGRQLGRTIGFPTANIEVAPTTAIPAVGVYAGQVLGHTAVINIGHRPTVEGRTDAPLSIEAHLLDFSGNLYGLKLSVEFIARLRGEQRFESLNALKSQIHKDIDYARTLFTS